MDVRMDGARATYWEVGGRCEWEVEDERPERARWREWGGEHITVRFRFRPGGKFDDMLSGRLGVGWTRGVTARCEWGRECVDVTATCAHTCRFGPGENSTTAAVLVLSSGREVCVGGVSWRSVGARCKGRRAWGGRMQ